MRAETKTTLAIVITYSLSVCSIFAYDYWDKYYNNIDYKRSFEEECWVRNGVVIGKYCVHEDAIIRFTLDE